MSEATVIILDVGTDSHRASDGKETFFSRAKTAVAKILQRKIFARPKDETALILMGTTETDNQVNRELDGGYEHITEKLPISCTSWQMLRVLDQEVQPEEAKADWLDAIVAAMTMLRNASQTRRFASQKIVIFTTFSAPVDVGNLEVTAANLTELQIQLLVINQNVQSGEEEGGPFSQTAGKSQRQRRGEEQIAGLVEKTNGVMCHIDNAELQLLYFEKKKVKGRPWDCPLQIGTKLAINVSVYLKVTETRVFGPWKTQSTDENAAVERKTQFYRNDQEIEPDPENLLTGYMYGSTVVPYAIEMEREYKAGEKSFICIGFTGAENVQEEHLSGTGCSLVVPQGKYPASERMFVALVEGMVRDNLAIIARRVYNRIAAPRLVVLLPHYVDRWPCLTLIELHYSEDSLMLQFPPLRSRKTKPSEEQLEAMGRLVDSMSLMKASDSGGEAFALNRTLNVTEQHLFRTVATRALKPTQPVPPISEELLKCLQTPEKVKAESSEPLQQVKDLFSLEIVQKPSKLDWIKKNLPNMASQAEAAVDAAQNGDIPAPTDTRMVTKVGTVYPADDFSLLLERGEHFIVVARQIETVIDDFVFKSFSASAVPLLKVAEAMLRYRDAARALGSAFKYNDWIAFFKGKLLAREKETLFDELVVKSRLGLITAAEADSSTVTPEEADAFYRFDQPTEVAPAAPTEDAEADLFDDM